MNAEEWEETIAAIVGKPYRWGGRGPDAFDCWGAVLLVLTRLGYSNLPDWVYEGGVENYIKHIQQESESTHWQLVDEPGIGDVVGLSLNRQLRHVGIVTPYGILHMLEKVGGVLSNRRYLSAIGYNILGYYRWVG